MDEAFHNAARELENALAVKLLARVRDALGTAETGDALVEVARNAHAAELVHAAMLFKLATLLDEYR